MGYLTPILIYNDAMTEISRDLSFGEKLYKASLKGTYSNSNPLYVHGYREKKTIISEVLRFFGYVQRPHKDNGKLRKRFQIQSSSSAAICLKPQHADTPRLLLVWKNDIVDLSHEGLDKCKYNKTPKGRTDTVYMNWLRQALSVSKKELKYFEEALKFRVNQEKGELKNG